MKARKEGKVRAYRKGARGQIPVWQLDWTDPDQARRRQTICATVAEMQQRCAEITHALFEGRCFGRDDEKADQTPIWTVQAALQRVIDSREPQGRYRAHLVAIANRFIDWVQTNRPNVRLWSDLQMQDFLAYIHALRDRNLCRTTIIAYTKILRAAARLLYEECQIPDQIHRIKVPETINDAIYQDERKAQKYLSYDTILSFLEFVREERFDLYAPLCLQAFAGLRILEALNLRLCDVDFEARTAEIQTTAHHKVKTESSRRTILLAIQIVDALKAHLQCQGCERGADDYFFKTQIATHWNDWSYHRAVKRLLVKFDLEYYRPRNLRACFISALRDDGADFRVVQRYVGHSLQDTMGKHYEIITLKKYRTEIVDRIERICRRADTMSAVAIV